MSCPYLVFSHSINKYVSSQIDKIIPRVNAVLDTTSPLSSLLQIGWTPLMYACDNGLVSVVHVLVEAHANLNAHSHVRNIHSSKYTILIIIQNTSS